MPCGIQRIPDSPLSSGLGRARALDQTLLEDGYEQEPICGSIRLLEDLAAK
jgi:hypothetical protein